MMSPVYSPDGKNAVLEIRSQDKHHCGYNWFSFRKITELDYQQDDAWIGPGIPGYSFSSGTLGVIDNSTFYFQSKLLVFTFVHV